MKASKKGSQVPLFTDREVRREYLKSKQWCKSHMRIKVHITGFACAYEEFGGAHRRDHTRPPKEGREQGSLYSQQKHAIADAIEWIRLNSKYKPRIFVATTPGFLEDSKEGSFIKSLTANLRNGYGMQHCVWVRELTKKGFPHFHFVADIDEFDPVKLSMYWSGLFGKEAKNSIRLGTRPDKAGKRKFWVSGGRMCWYLSKYIGKDLEPEVIPGEKKKRKAYRTFAISETARKESQPLLFNSYTVENYKGLHDRQFMIDDEQAEEGKPYSINPYAYRWKWTGHGQTYIGFNRDRT